MFCQKCGEKIEDTQNFCQKCGISNNKNIPPINMPKKSEGKIRSKLTSAPAVIVYVITFILAATIVRYAIQEGTSYLSSNGATNANQSAPVGYEFTSADQKFSITFPDQPQREEEMESDEDFGQIKTITYSSSKNETNYYVFVFEYSDPRINDSAEDFDVSAGLEGALNGMLNNAENTELISSGFEQLLGKKALKYKIKVGTEILVGIIVFNGNRAYNIALDYFTDNDTLSTDIKLSKFINSFKFNP